MAGMHAWLDVTAGVAGDMLMGALVDAGAPLEGIQQAVRAVAGPGVALRREEVTRGGMRATKVHVDLAVAGTGGRSWPQLRETLLSADIHPATRQTAIRVFERFVAAYGRGHGIAEDEVTLAEVGALDSLSDIVGDCEALRLLGVTSVSASPVAVGAGRIHTSHGDLPVPVPAVAELALGWGISRPAAALDGPDAEGAADWDSPDPDGAVTDTALDVRHLPMANATVVDGMVTEGPARSVEPGQLGELATPTGMALLRGLAERCEPLPPMTLAALGVGAGGRDVPGRPNVVRVLLGSR